MPGSRLLYLRIPCAYHTHLFDLQEPFCACVWPGGLLTSGMKYVLRAGLNGSLASFPFDLQRPFLHMLRSGGLLTSGMKSMWSGQGPVRLHNCPASSLVLEFQSIGNKSPVALPSEGLSTSCPDNKPLCIHHLPSTIIKSLQILYHPHASPLLPTPSQTILKQNIYFL